MKSSGLFQACQLVILAGALIYWGRSACGYWLGVPLALLPFLGCRAEISSAASGKITAWTATLFGIGVVLLGAPAEPIVKLAEMLVGFRPDHPYKEWGVMTNTCLIWPLATLPSYSVVAQFLPVWQGWKRFFAAAMIYLGWGTLISALVLLGTRREGPQ